MKKQYRKPKSTLIKLDVSTLLTVNSPGMTESTPQIITTTIYSNNKEWNLSKGCNELIDDEDDYEY